MPWVRGITFAKREKYLEEFQLNDEAVDEVQIVIISLILLRLQMSTYWEMD
jgi:hypothetical protein